MNMKRVLGLAANVACVAIVGAAALGVVGPNTSMGFAQSLSSLSSLPVVSSGTSVDEPGSLALLATGITAGIYLVTRARMRRRQG